MAAVTLLGVMTFNTTSGTKTVTATPAVGDLIVIVTAHSGNTSAATPTDNNSSGTYQTGATAQKKGDADTMRVHVRRALIGSASSTIFTHAPGTSTGGGLAVFAVKGMSQTGLAAIRQSAVQNNQASGTPAPVFPGACLGSNSLIGAVFYSDDPPVTTPPSGFTERSESGYGTPNASLETVSRDSGETGLTISWGNSLAVTFCSLILELNGAGAFPATMPNLNAKLGPAGDFAFGNRPAIWTPRQAIYIGAAGKAMIYQGAVDENTQYDGARRLWP